MAFISNKELIKMGFRSVGKSVQISDKVSIYCPEKMSIGDNVRIDDFCVLSAAGPCGRLSIGSNIHIATYVGIYAGAGIKISDYCTISSKSTLYSKSDDYSGEFLVGPIFPEKFLNVDRRPIVMKKFSQIGAHSLVLPGVLMEQGSVLGAMSMAKSNLKSWTIYGGVPARELKQRKKDMKDLADLFADSKNVEDCMSIEVV